MENLPEPIVLRHRVAYWIWKKLVMFAENPVIAANVSLPKLVPARVKVDADWSPGTVIVLAKVMA